MKTNQSILITGSGKGLGFCVTKKHLQRGDTVYALEYQITQELSDLIKEFPTLTVRQCDLGHTKETEQALHDLLASKTPVDILYNIAGIFFESERVPLEQTDIERCAILYNVNTLGPLRVMKYTLPLLHSGTVVMNVTSESGSVTDCKRCGEYGYSMSKAALNMASKTFSNQLQGKNIRVFCYHPGWMKTDMGGEGALLSPTSLTPDEAADAIMDITLHPEKIPSDVMYLDYKQTPLKW